MSGKDIRESVGLLLVVASMVFVGLEIRQNTSVARAAAYEAFMGGMTDHLSLLATDAVLVPLVLRVEAGALPEDFSVEEQFRIRLNFLVLLRNWEGLYRSVGEDILPPHTLDVVGAGGAFSNEYFRSLWPSRLRASFTTDFIEFFEDLGWNDVG